MTLSRLLALLLLTALLPIPVSGQEKYIPALFPKMGQERRKLIMDYDYALDFANCILKPAEALAKRRAWHREGYRYTNELLEGLHSRREADAAKIIILLGGTHDDRAALSLLDLLESDPPQKVKWAIYAALAELGYYTDYHARLLLQAATDGRTEKSGNTTWDTALFLCTIHHPEAVWAQDQLYERHLVDGALSEQTGVLLEFRDRALGR